MIAAGILLGMGEAGFFDGILLHQILQWHHMLTSIQPATNIGNLEVNTLWNGLFNASTYGMTVAGLVLLWRWCASCCGRLDSIARWATGCHDY